MRNVPRTCTVRSIDSAASLAMTACITLDTFQVCMISAHTMDGFHGEVTLICASVQETH